MHFPQLLTKALFAQQAIAGLGNPRATYADVQSDRLEAAFKAATNELPAFGALKVWQAQDKQDTATAVQRMARAAPDSQPPFPPADWESSILEVVHALPLRTLDRVRIDFDEPPKLMCVSVDSATMTRHAPEGCRPEALREARRARLIGGVRVGPSRDNSAMQTCVHPRPGSYRSEGALNPIPIIRSDDTRTTYRLDVRFSQPPRQGPPTIFMQIKECGGELKRAFGHGCSKPAVALKITSEGRIFATINQVAPRFDGKPRELRKNIDLHWLNSERMGANADFQQFEVALHRVRGAHGVVVRMNGKLVLAYRGPFGSPDSNAEYVKWGIYSPQSRENGPGERICLQFDNLEILREEMPPDAGRGISSRQVKSCNPCVWPPRRW
ncbi:MULTISPECIES: hypothetical protein [Dyella]|uniref:Uncharacterized protein n=2 Tax=Dyella TaxID=231454 RepID=A0A4R0YIP9_9GAMM|nr:MULTISPECIES: hypothetical protein [Dyella]TBR36588.1 hypothetical protein EYV96_11690 [Dyella terrae]TCI08320.1 hypothetical protein EZM97_27180 [Dyella soli]